MGSAHVAEKRGAIHCSGTLPPEASRTGGDQDGATHMKLVTHTSVFSDAGVSLRLRLRYVTSVYPNEINSHATERRE